MGATISDIEIREENPADYLAIGDVVNAAFRRNDEAKLVDALRAKGDAVLSLVAVEGSRLVGHIMFSTMHIDDGQKEWPAIGLAPLAVVPDHQSQGIGSALAERGIELCRQGGFERMFVLGHPAYYPQFGFVAASKHDILDTDGAEEAFMALPLVEGAFKGIIGVAHYAPAFGSV